MRRISIPELINRAKQALLSRAEGIPCFRKLVLKNADKYLAVDTHLKTFARLPDILLNNSVMGVPIDCASLEPCYDELLRRSADLALEGYFNLLGIERLAFGYPINWHLEPTSGCRSPLIPWKWLDSLDPSLTGDKKIVWELNRHQHLVMLGRAFLYARTDDYAAAVGEHITSWIRENPTGLGINWVSSLELAFRCISWLWAIALVRTRGKWQLLPLQDIARVLHYHGCHIETYLSTYSSPNTHLTGEALGLYYLGTCMPEINRAQRWRTLGRSILLQQLEKHVRPDGVYFEQSTWYHRYTADFYMHFIILAERFGEPLPAHVHERLTALLDHLMWITRPDGTSPHIGDDDGGKLVKLEERAFNDWRAILSNGAVMFGRGDYKHVAGEFAEETHWLLGPEAKDKFERIPTQTPAPTSRAFTEGGFYAMRSGWDPCSNYLLIDCGPHGVMNCGHAHADALAIEVAALGATILVDPGTFTYTGSAELRDLFRSTAMHNTLTIDGLSSSVPAGPFKWKHIATCALRCWHDHPGFTYFEGSHDGYKRLPDPATHTRTVLFANREYWVMLDQVDATSEHEYAVHYHMAPGIEAVLRQETGRLTANAASATLDITYFDEQGSWQVTEGLVSPCYAAKVVAPYGIYSVRANGPVVLLSVLFPRVPGESPPIIRNLDPKQGKSLSLTTLRFHDFVVWSERAVAEEHLHDTDFEWVWVRRTSDDYFFERIVLLHGKHVSLHEFEFTAECPLEFVSISVQDKMLSIDLSPSTGIRARPPAGIDHIVVNGGIHPLGSDEILELSQGEVPALAVARDKTGYCKYVRH